MKQLLKIKFNPALKLINQKHSLFPIIISLERLTPNIKSNNAILQDPIQILFWNWIKPNSLVVKLKWRNPKGKAATPTYKIPFSESHVAGLLKLHVLVEHSWIHILVRILLLNILQTILCINLDIISMRCLLL